MPNGFGLLGNLPPEGVMSPPPAQGRGFFERLGDVFTGPPGAGLSPEQESQARRQAILNAGLAMLAASGQGGLARQTLGQIIAQGAMTGQQVAGGARQQLGRQNTLNRIQEIAGQGPITQESLREIFGVALSSGDPELFRSVAGVLAALQGQGQQPRRRTQITSIVKDGVPTRVLVDLDTGEQIRELGQEFRFMSPFRTPSAFIDPTTGEARLGVFNIQTGQFQPVEDAAPLVAGTEAERKAQAFLGFIPDHVEFLDRFVGTPGRVEQALSDRGLREFTSAEQQQLRLAGAALAEAWLRLTTGAAYNEREFQTAFEMFIPQPGDRTETLEAKERNRKNLLQMLRDISKRLRPAQGTPGVVGEDPLDEEFNK